LRGRRGVENLGQELSYGSTIMLYFAR
jgi:hypothetical protein